MKGTQVLRRRALVGFVAVTAVLAPVACDNEESADQDPVLLDYTLSGGFIGRDDHLVINDDGSATLETRDGDEGPVTLSDEEFDSIEELVGELDWDELEGDHPPPDNVGVADGYQYRFVHEGVMVTTEDAGVPSELEPLIQALSSIMNRT